MQSDTSQKISEAIQNSAGEKLNPEQAAPGSSESSAQNLKKGSANRKMLLWFLCGILWGVALTFIAGVLYLRHNLIQEMPLAEDFTHTADKVGPVAQKYGWRVSYNDCGLPRLIDNQPVEVYRFCKSRYRNTASCHSF